MPSDISQEAFAFGCQTTGVGIAEWDLQGDQIRWSPELEALYELDPGTFAGTFAAFEEYVHPQDLPLVRHTIEQAIREGGSYQLEFQVVTATGAVSCLHSIGKIVQQQGRSVLLEVVRPSQHQPVVNDLDIALQVKWRKWMGYSRDVFFQVVAPDQIVCVSEAVQKEFGHSPLALEGQSFLLNVLREDHPQVRSALQQLFRFGSSFTLEFHYWHHSRRWVKVEGYGLRSEGDSEHLVFIRNTAPYQGGDRL
ncbi:MAG: PAS domain-containing protein [Oculatellaceae cyanobacterium Prado106]|nr:PAS domain-containing protein [Oculatellaceae cyanobacterium Prado106]